MRRRTILFLMVALALSAISLALYRARTRTESFTEADNIVMLVSAGATAGQQEAAKMPAEQLVPAIVRQLNSLPPTDSANISDVRVKRLRLDGMIEDLSKRTSFAELSDALLKAWPLATQDHTKAQLFHYYAERQTAEAEPLALQEYQNRNASRDVRENAAGVLAIVGWAKHRALLLSAFDADDSFARLAFEVVLYDRREIDPLVVSIAAKRIEFIARSSAGEAGSLAALLGRYTGEQNGVSGTARASYAKTADRSQDLARELQFFRDWWGKKKAMIESAADNERAQLGIHRAR